MSKMNNRFYPDFLDDTDDFANMDLSDLRVDSLDDFLEPFKTNEDLSNASTSFVSHRSSQSEHLSQLNNQAIPQTSTILTVSGQPTGERLQIVEQPFQSSKLRYRADYVREKGRLGALGNRNEKSKLKGPVIHIPQYYLNPTDRYFIRVSLVTIKYNKTNVHYFHPYELEHPKHELFNDRQNNSVWFPIESNDSLKNFPLLRIVKKKGFSVQKCDHLRVFDCHESMSLSQHWLKKEIDIIKEYNLDKSQLAFTLGKKVINNGQSTMVLYTDTTIFSEEMNEYNERYSDNETDTESSSDKTTIDHFIYKYAPKSGSRETNDEMLVFLKKKLESKKYGDLQVIFECNILKGHWSQPVVDFDIKDRMISFKIPTFPYYITKPVTVNIVLRQDNRILGILTYSYLPTSQYE